MPFNIFISAKVYKIVTGVVMYSLLQFIWSDIPT